MEKMSQLKQIREQMMEELTQIPQYRALKAIDRFMGEISEIYGSAANLATGNQSEEEKAAVHDGRARELNSTASQKITPYIPAHRVA